MKAHKLSFATLQTGLILVATMPAHAANGRFSQDSDIVGLKLTMNRDEARRLVELDHAGATIAELPVIVTLNGFQQKAMAGFVADLATANDKAANQSKADEQQKDLDARKAAGFGDSPLNKTVAALGDYAQDRIKVLFNPNDGATDIFGVSRFTEYGAGKQPVTKTMIDALTEKYGAPTRTRSDSADSVTFTWLAAGSAKTQQSRCNEDSGFSQLYEAVGDSGFYGMPNLVNSTGEFFINLVNMIHTKNQFVSFASCGTVLQIKLTLVQNKDYVGRMSARLNDLGKAYAELNTFGDTVWRAADEAKQKKLNQDAGAKPNL